MVGVITGRDILAHPIVTIQCFGWQVFFRAIVPWQSHTFLSLLQYAAAPRTRRSGGSMILERCINLELRAKRIYTTFAKALDENGLVSVFFAGLAEQEQYHADLLGLCRAASLRMGWTVSVFSPWEDYLPRLEHAMDAAEAALREIDTLDAALGLVIQIESSEVNQVFHAAMAASDAAFVRKLRPFQEAMEAHMAYIVERLPELSPTLLPACREMRAKFLQMWT